MTTAQKKVAPAEEAPEALSDRIVAAEQRIATLRETRAEALLAGEDFDGEVLRAAEDALEGLEDALAAQHRQAQAQAQEAASRDAERLRAEALEFEQKRVAAVEQAEALARGMVEAMAAAEACRAEVETRFQQLGIGGRPSRREQTIRLARALSAVLAPVADNSAGTRLGDLVLRRGFNRPGDAWGKFEADTTKRIKHALERT